MNLGPGLAALAKATDMNSPARFNFPHGTPDPTVGGGMRDILGAVAVGMVVALTVGVVAIFFPPSCGEPPYEPPAVTMPTGEAFGAKLVEIARSKPYSILCVEIFTAKGVSRYTFDPWADHVAGFIGREGMTRPEAEAEANAMFRSWGEGMLSVEDVIGLRVSYLDQVGGGSA